MSVSFILLQHGYSQFIHQYLQNHSSVLLLSEIWNDDFFEEKIITKKQVEMETDEFLFWTEAEIIKNITGRLSNIITSKNDKKIIKHTMLSISPILFRVLLLKYPVTFYCNLQKKESKNDNSVEIIEKDFASNFDSREVMRHKRDFNLLLKNKFAKIEEDFVYVKTQEIEASLKRFFFIQNCDQEAVYKKVLEESTVLSAFYQLFVGNEYMSILEKFQDDKDYSEGGAVAEYVHSSTKLVITECNRVIMPILRLFIDHTQSNK